MSAMLAGTIPEVNFGDPLGSVAPVTPGPADVPPAAVNRDASSPNGRETPA
jgi:hypothetical protein